MLAGGQVEAIVERYALGAGAHITGPTARGYHGEVWKLATSRGTWAVKRHFVHHDEAEVREDVDFQDAAAAAGVPTPVAVRTIGGDVLLDLGKTQVRVNDWVDLRDADPCLDPVAVGRVVAELHCVEFAGPRPEHPWYTDSVGAERWDELGRALDAAHAPFADEFAGLHGELVALEALLEPVAELQTCHRDLWADNLRGTAEGGVCVIDWDNFGLADPTHELAALLYEFAFRDPQRARALHDAYRAAGGPGRVHRRGHFSMAIAQLGHLNELSCERWLDPATSDLDRERNAARFGEFVDRPLTRDVIDELLDAVAP
jgi:Ser/Thr protein kinase RdoA (MazF antagonist)